MLFCKLFHDVFCDIFICSLCQYNSQTIYIGWINILLDNYNRFNPNSITFRVRTLLCLRFFRPCKACDVYEAINVTYVCYALTLLC